MLGWGADSKPCTAAASVNAALQQASAGRLHLVHSSSSSSSSSKQASRQPAAHLMEVTTQATVPSPPHARTRRLSFTCWACLSPLAEPASRFSHSFFSTLSGWSLLRSNTCTGQHHCRLALHEHSAMVLCVRTWSSPTTSANIEASLGPTLPPDLTFMNLRSSQQFVCM